MSLATMYAIIILSGIISAFWMGFVVGTNLVGKHQKVFKKGIPLIAEQQSLAVYLYANEKDKEEHNLFFDKPFTVAQVGKALELTQNEVKQLFGSKIKVNLCLSLC